MTVVIFMRCTDRNCALPISTSSETRPVITRAPAQTSDISNRRKQGLASFSVRRRPTSLPPFQIPSRNLVEWLFLRLTPGGRTIERPITVLYDNSRSLHFLLPPVENAPDAPGDGRFGCVTLTRRRDLSERESPRRSMTFSRTRRYGAAHATLRVHPMGCCITGTQRPDRARPGASQLA
jgi:hypothetical protein